jgi:hypothetical protein
MMSNTEFKLPIYYNAKKRRLQDHIVKDLELLETEDPENTKPVYDSLVTSETPTQTKKQFSEFYTTDTLFLKDTQTLLKQDFTSFSSEKNNLLPFDEVWRETKGDLSFKDKYMYLTWPSLQFLNEHEMFLQFMSVYTLASPVISLIMPILVLIMPFFMIKIKGLPVTLDDYILVLKRLIANHAITKLFTEFHSVDINQKIYILASAAFYFFSIYQNIVTCLKFYTNMTRMEQCFRSMEHYLTCQTKNMDLFVSFCEPLATYSDFVLVLKEKREILGKFLESIRSTCYFQPTEKSTYFSIMLRMIEIGKSMKLFYQFYNCPLLHSAFDYSFGFDGYVIALRNIQLKLKESKINFAKYASKKCNIKGNLYAPLCDQKPVKSDISFEKSMIITGPNASGKTTVLKSVLLNIIFSQQFGVGFFDSATIKPFDYIHCYLNIPDTSGRDSLFQAEARRCKDILDSMDPDSNETHFCVFDELYSGTNPEEAVSAATAFMKYLSKNKHVYCMLTTHFVKVCRSLKNAIHNFQMETAVEASGNVKYLYSLKEGISTVKGGLNVLTNMNYPKEILDDAKL